MSSRELSEWMAFYRLEPFGFDAQMLGHAITSTIIANSNRKKGAKPFDIRDLMPKIDAPEQEEGVDGAVQFVATITAMMGGKDLRNTDGND